MAVQIQTLAGAVFGPSGANHSQGLVPDPGSVSGTTRVLFETATFSVMPFTALAPAGTAGQVLTSNGTVSAATFQNAATATFLSPSITSLTSGSGTVTPITGALYLHVRMCGGGGGGGSSAGTGTGSTGGTSTFGSWTAIGGSGGQNDGTGVAGGAGGTGGATGTGSLIVRLAGGSGLDSQAASAANSGAGGNNPFGGAAGGVTSGVGGAGSTNTGSGGSGGATTGGGTTAAGGGGSGEYVEFQVNTPGSIGIAYAVGGSGAGGTAGGNAGGAGGSGVILVRTYFQ